MKSIGQAAGAFHLSTRTLRYWESLNLLRSTKLPGSHYRAYDEQALVRIGQILILRRLRIPLKEISRILDADDVQYAVRALEKAILQSERDMLASSQLRLLQQRLLQLLRNAAPDAPASRCLADETLVRMAGALPTLVQDTPHKEDTTMPDLLSYPQRTVHLPPMTVACARYFGIEPEGPAFEQLAAFIRKSNLPEVYPALRIFGFNNPSVPNEKGEYGYEYWVSVPEDWPVPAPLTNLTDVVFLTELLNELFNEAVMHYITLGGLDEALPLRMICA